MSKARRYPKAGAGGPAEAWADAAPDARDESSTSRGEDGTVPRSRTLPSVQRPRVRLVGPSRRRPRIDVVRIALLAALAMVAAAPLFAGLRHASRYAQWTADKERAMMSPAEAVRPGARKLRGSATETEGAAAAAAAAGVAGPVEEARDEKGVAGPVEEVREATGAADEAAVEVPSGDRNPDNQCSIYLAPSAVADSNNRPAGFGVYTTRPISENEEIFSRGSGSVVPVVDFRENYGRTPSFLKSIFLPNCVGMGIESDVLKKGTPYPDSNERCFKYNNNAGSLVNYHPVLVNLKADDADAYVDNWLSRYTDAGAGAFSYYLGERFRASRNIAAGEELYNEYEEAWFFDKILGKEGKRIPHKVNYLRAATAINAFTKKYGKKGSISKKQLHWFHAWAEKTLDGLSKRLVDRTTPTVAAVLELLRSSLNYAGPPEERLAKRIATHTTLDRDVDWIRSNGRCLDNVYPQRSSISQAGQGGFAARPIPKGAVIVPAPTMVQVTDKSALNMFRRKASGKREPVPYTKQLLTNYCFGHDDSKMLLCPATNANLINHCSTRLTEPIGQCDPSKGPNAIVRWATEFDPETAEWLTQGLDKIDARIKDGRRGLSLEIVALRDISPDEEIFLDYGRSWEEAWHQHVSSWKPPADDGSFVPVAEMNQDVGKYLLTKAQIEGGATYSHKNVRVGCVYREKVHPCEILSKGKDDDLTYKVSVRRWKDEGEDESDYYGSYEWPHKDNTVTVDGMPVSSIKFFAGPNSSDAYLEGTFRHHIGVPDEMWPEHWLNAKRTG